MSHKKVCNHYRQGRCRLEKGCIFFHPQEQSKSSIKAPDTSNGLSCCPDSPLERPNGEEDDNKSLEAHTHEIEGDINDNAFHDDSPDRMDQAPYSDGEFNGNQPDPPHPRYDDEAYKEQPDNGPSNLSHRTDSVDRDVEETYANPVEPVSKYFKPSREERSFPPPATQLQARQPVALPVVPPPKYPHVSEITPHWTHFADPHASKVVPFCKQLAQRECSQGDRCRFRHSLTVEEYTLLFNDQQPNLWTLRRDSVNETTVSSPTPQPQVDSPHTSSAVKSSVFGPCKFHPIGKCHNGTSCPFDHTQQPTEPVPTVSNADQERQISESERSKKSQRPCHFHFGERGFCHRGLSCKFGHGNVDGNHPSSGPSGPESAPIFIDDDEGGRENQANNNSGPYTHAEDNGWGGADWDRPSNAEDHSAWDSPSGNDHNHQELSNKPLNSEAPKTENGGWPPTDDSSHSVPWTTASPVQCPYYLKGNCRNDTSCHMSHDSEEKPQEGRSKESYKAENPTNEPGEIVQNETQSTWEMEMESKTLSENEPKAQEGGSQDSQILDNEATWSQSQEWHTETAQPPPFPIKIDAPCKRFGQGYCPLKDDCTYLHIIEDSDIVEHTGNSEGDVSVSISLK